MSSGRFESHPRLTVALLVLVSALTTDFAFTYVYRRLAPKADAAAKYRTRSEVFHHGLVPMARVDAERWGPLVYPYRTNSLGFRDRDTRVVPLVGARPRLVFMGDSFTEGVGVAYEKSFVGLVDAALAREGIEVLNAGVSLYSPTIYYRKTRALLEETGLRFDELVVFIDISDIQDEVAFGLDAEGDVVLEGRRRGREEKLNGQYLNPVFRLRRVKAFVEEHTLALAALYTLLERPFASDRHRAAAWTTDPQVYADYGRAGLARSRERMDALAGLLKRHGTRLAVAVYPWTDQLQLGDRDSVQAHYWRDWAKAGSVDFLDLFPAFFGAGEPRQTAVRLFIPGDIHWNEAGHRLVAEEFLKHYHAR